MIVGFLSYDIFLIVVFELVKSLHKQGRRYVAEALMLPLYTVGRWTDRKKRHNNIMRFEGYGV